MERRISMSASPNIEEGTGFQPKFGADGLIVCVTSDAASGAVLMVAYMNSEALAKTVQSGEAWYYSRSRQALWRKGETSGHVQRVVEIRVDCDQDAIWLQVEQVGPGACHTGRVSCFYRIVTRGEDGKPVLAFAEAGQTFDPAQVYKSE